MTPEEIKRINAILKEHLQDFVLVGHDLEGRRVRCCDYETDVQNDGLSNIIRCELNRNGQAPEVWVRNFEEDNG